MPKPESVKCEHIELIVSGGRAEDAAEDMCLVGEAEIGSGGLSIVVSGSPVFTVLFMRVRSHGCMQNQDGVRKRVRLAHARLVARGNFGQGSAR